MLGRDKMLRVTKKSPCPVCGKPDWCLAAPDGSAAMCQRIKDGSVRRCGDAGWLHILRESVHNVHRGLAIRRKLLPIGTADEERHREFELLTQEYRQQLTERQLNDLAVTLGVSADSLRRLGVGWDRSAYTFPMFSDFGKIIGIRRRFPDGRKVSAAGSRTGLFIPTGLDSGKPLLVCEGPTDCGAALDLDFDAVGRPNCNSRVQMIAKAARGRAEIIIVSDNDLPGRKGAQRLAEVLVLHYSSVKIISPPQGIKDLRQWLAAGLSQSTLQQVIDYTRAIQITICRSRET